MRLRTLFWVSVALPCEVLRTLRAQSWATEDLGDVPLYTQVDDMYGLD